MRNTITTVKQKSSILLDNGGIAAIEFAILLPIFLVITLGAIEFGMYFVKDEIVNSTVSSVSLALERNPNYFSSMPLSQQNAVIASWGSGLVKFSQIGQKNGNYICVDAFASPPTKAQASAPCTSTYFNTANPNGPTSTQPYYIAVRSNLQKGTITPLGNFVPAVKNIQVSQSSGTVQVGNMLPPTCNQPGQALQWNGTNFICANPPQCQPWQKLTWNGTALICQNVPYVIAQGIAHPSQLSGGTWETNDQTYPASAYGYGWHSTFTICQRRITFAIPSGLPAGSILPQASLIYPYNQPDGESNWHQWVVSFLHWIAPAGGGTGSFDMCIANGGNWGNGQGATVNSEHVSWSVTFYPGR
jgi:Flp pilus assembly protein TadG